MKWIRNYKLFKEAIGTQVEAQVEKQVKPVYTNKNLIHEICVSMVLLNNSFLDNILDRGLKARYSENSEIFITDLKNLVLAKNRLNLGRFEGDTCVDDGDLGKINGLFEDSDFNIEKDWDKLVNARITARNIIDKLIPDAKLESDEIKAIYWIGPNKDKEHNEDIVIETKDGKQYSLFLNKSLSTQKTASFNTFADDLIGADIERLYGEEYMPRWSKLTQEWVKLIYENSNKNIQQYIEKFIDPKRIETMGYFEYFDIRHQDPRFKHLGEFIEEFDKNILKFSDLLNEIWKQRENCFMDVQRVEKEWYETKIVILNSKILENLLTTSLKTNFADDIQKIEGDNYKLSGGTVKMKLFKTLVEKLGCLERPTYFLGNNGNQFNMAPSREFFRKYYDEINLKFDYHVNFEVSEEEENNDFRVKIGLDLDEERLIDMTIFIKFSGSELSGKLSAKYKYELADNFNYLIAKKESGQSEVQTDDFDEEDIEE
jgi:hypothetical protein